MKYIFDHYSLLDVLLPFLFILSLFLMPYLHNYTHSYVWKEYRTLVLPIKYSNLVEQILSEHNIKGVISKQSVKKRFQNIEEDSYPFTLKERYSHWFENETDGLSYIYIPQKSYIPFKFLKELNKKNIPFYLEGEPHLHYINLSCIFLLFFFFLLFSNRKILFFFTSIPFLLLSFLITSSLMLYIIALLLLSNLHIIEIFFAPTNLNQEQRKGKIKKNAIIFIISIFALILMMFDSYLSYIYVFLSVIASLSIGYVIEKFNYLAEKEKDANRAHEKPIFHSMHPHFSEKIWSRKKAIITLVFFFISFTPRLVFHLFYNMMLPRTYTNTLYVPMPSRVNREKDFTFSSYSSCLKNKSGDALPDLTDYVLDTWFYNVFPYLDVRYSIEQPKEDETVIFRDFYKTELNTVKEKEPLVFTFNNTFIKKTLESVQRNSIEEMLKKEGGFVSVFYNFKFFPIGRHNVLLISFSLLFIFISWIIILFKMCY
ncbi:MAG: hypothetical protein ACTTIZ_01405 [Treponema sp.]